MEECDLHQMENCAVCNGLDDELIQNHEGGTVHAWSEDDRRIAGDPKLTTGGAAIILGRPINQVSAYRIQVLKMKSWAGYKPKPRG